MQCVSTNEKKNFACRAPPIPTESSTSSYCSICYCFLQFHFASSAMRWECIQKKMQPSAGAVALRTAQLHITACPSNPSYFHTSEPLTLAIPRQTVGHLSPFASAAAVQRCSSCQLLDGSTPRWAWQPWLAAPYPLGRDPTRPTRAALGVKHTVFNAGTDHPPKGSAANPAHVLVTVVSMCSDSPCSPQPPAC